MRYIVFALMMGVAFFFPAVARSASALDLGTRDEIVDLTPYVDAVSVGVGYFPEPSSTLEALFAAADANMYRVKQGIRAKVSS